MNSIVDYFEKEFELSAIEKAKLKYSMDVLFADISKFLILLTIFCIIGETKEFIYSSLALLTIRPFTGGLHFKTYTGCLIFTGFFFTASVILYNSISLNLLAPIFFVFFFIIELSIAPIISKNRPSYSNTRRLKFKVTGLVVITIHYLSYIMVSKNPYLNISIWVIALQSVQLLIKKGVDIFENKNKSYQTFS